MEVVYYSCLGVLGLCFLYVIIFVISAAWASGKYSALIRQCQRLRQAKGDQSK